MVEPAGSRRRLSGPDEGVHQYLVAGSDSEVLTFFGIIPSYISRIRYLQRGIFYNGNGWSLRGPWTSATATNFVVFRIRAHSFLEALCPSPEFSLVSIRPPAFITLSSTMFYRPNSFLNNTSGHPVQHYHSTGLQYPQQQQQQQQQPGRMVVRNVSGQVPNSGYVMGQYTPVGASAAGVGRLRD